MQQLITFFFTPLQKGQDACRFTNLPHSVLENIFEYLHPIEVIRLRRLHSNLKDAIDHAGLWKNVCSSICLFDDTDVTETLNNTLKLKNCDHYWLKAFVALCDNELVCTICLQGEQQYTRTDGMIQYHIVNNITTFGICTECHTSCENEFVAFITKWYDWKTWKKYRHENDHRNVQDLHLCMHEFDEDLETEMDEVYERKKELCEALSDVHLELRDDSRLCWNYIIDDGGEVSYIVQQMQEMAWFFKHTTYAEARQVCDDSHDSGDESYDEEFFPRYRIDSKRGKQIAIMEWIARTSIKDISDIESVKEEEGRPPQSLWPRMEEMMNASTTNAKRKRV